MNQTRLQKIRDIAAIVVAVTSLVLLPLFVLINAHRFDQIESVRHDGRISACLAFNEDVRDNVNALNDRTQDLVRDTFNGVRSQARDPKDAAAIDAYIVSQTGKFDAVKIAKRDCTDQGVEDFYKRGRR